MNEILLKRAILSEADSRISGIGVVEGSAVASSAWPALHASADTPFCKLKQSCRTVLIRSLFPHPTCLEEQNRTEKIDGIEAVPLCGRGVFRV